MMGVQKVRVLSKKGIIILFLLICIPVSSRGAGITLSDTLQYTEPTPAKSTGLFKKTVNLIIRMLEQDSTYVRPTRYNMTLTPQYTFGYEYYRFSTKDRKQSISISPSANNKIGITLGCRGIYAGYSFTLNNSQPEFDMELTFYYSRVGLELFYRRRSDGFNITGLNGFNENGRALTNYNKEFDGLTTSQLGANVFYVFNYRKFSFPAAYKVSAEQRISAGSFIMGFNYNEQLFVFDHTRIDPKIESLMSPELRFKKVDYMDFSINFGYSYNWVFAKNCLLNVSAIPAIGYKTTELKIVTSPTEFTSNINIDLVSRLALVYNNGKYYAGASFVSHTYTYTKPELSILNGFGYLKVYAGFNFWRRKNR